MTPYWIALALLSADDVFTVDARGSIVLVVTTPSGEEGRVSRSQLIHLVSARLDRHTGLSPALFDDAILSDCRGLLTCVVARVREVHSDVPHLLLLTNLTQAHEPDLSTVLLIDLTAAARVLSDPEATARIEEEAVLGRSERGQVADENAAEEFLDLVFASVLRAPLEKAGAWEPYGKIVLRSLPADTTVRIDGQLLGTTRGERTVLRDVRPGDRMIRLEHAERPPYELEIPVARGRQSTREIEIPLEPQRNEAARILFWTGVGAFSAGAIAMIAAAATVDRDIDYCGSMLADACDPGTRFPRGPGGILWLPLGYSLATAGAAWALGAYFFEDAGWSPWWQLALGFSLGAMAYGFTEMLQ